MCSHLHQWGYSDNPLCICGDTQSMSHIINDCVVNEFEGGLETLHIVSSSATEWLRHIHCMIKKKVNLLEHKLDLL